MDVKNLTAEVPKKEGDATKAKGLATDKAKQVEKLRVEAKAEEQRALDLEKQAQEARWRFKALLPNAGSQIQHLLILQR